MNVKEALITGLKIVGGILAGVAVFFGIGKLLNKNKKENEEENTTTTTEENLEESQQTEEQSKEEGGDNGDKFQKVVNGFRSFQNVFGKIFILLQSLTSLVENTSRVFSKDSTNFQPTGYQQPGPGWSYSQPINVTPDGQFWTRRVSPFITEVGTCNDSYYGGSINNTNPYGNYYNR